MKPMERDENIQKSILKKNKQAPFNKVTGVDGIFSEEFQVDSSQYSKIIWKLWQTFTETKYLLVD